MNRYWGIYKNKQYKVGLTGGSIQVYSLNDTLIFKISKLNYVYTGLFIPNTNRFIARGANQLLLLDLDQQKIVKKVTIKNVQALSDYECTISEDGKLFYNIEMDTNLFSRVSIFNADDLSFLNYIFEPSNDRMIHCIEMNKGMIYLLCTTRNNSFIGILENGNIKDSISITDEECNHIKYNRSYYLNGKTELILKWHMFHIEKVEEKDKSKLSLKYIYEQKRLNG